MAMFNKVAIIGTGLIGGSLALAIKKQHLAKEVIGVSRHKESLSIAKHMHAIDRGSINPEIIKDADLLVFATPVNAIIDLAAKFSRIIKKDCIVTDVGSTKELIVSRLGKIFPNFVGCHPLAGSDKRGIANAKASLFSHSLCILTPVKNTDKTSLNKLSALWKKIGARVVMTDPIAHDKILALVSHLPHAAAFSLINAVPDAYLGFASSGLKDTTRIASSESELWVDIFFSNHRNIVRSIDLFNKSLTDLKLLIQKKDRPELVKFLRKAKEKRVRLE